MMTQETINKLQRLEDIQRSLTWLGGIAAEYESNIAYLKKARTGISSVACYEGDSGKRLDVNCHRPISKQPIIRAFEAALAKIRKEIPALEAEVEALFTQPLRTENNEQ